MDLSQYLTINYANTVPKAIINNGAQIQTQFNTSPSDSINLDGTTYDLSQFHYHDPAENQVNGYTCPMEEHFVNVSASGAETVIGVFLQLGAFNPSLQPILDAASADLTTPNSKTTINTPINFAGLLPTSMEGWFYEGSLTTPPLSQVVNWLVLATPITLNYTQLVQYEEVASGSGFLPGARPIQPLDGRQVNEFNIDVNFQSQPITGADFSFARNNAAARGTHISVLSTSGAAAKRSQLVKPALVNDKASGTIVAQAAAQGFQPVSGCNCPLCQMLRNAIWHQVTAASNSGGQSASAVAAAAATVVSVPASAYWSSL